MIKHYILIGFLLLMHKNYAQKEYNQLEGFYNLSGFEMASGIYLLEDQTFFYFASFGAVDLKISGNYTLQKQGLLSLKPNKELMQEFYVYGFKSKVNQDSIVVKYRKPIEESIENLRIGHNKTEFPKFTPEKNTVSVTIKKPDTNLLKIEYEKDTQISRDFSIQLIQNVNELWIIHNYYADMTRQFSKAFFKIEKDALIDEKQKAHKREPIDNETKTKIKAFIEEQKQHIIKKNDQTIYRLKVD